MKIRLFTLVFLSVAGAALAGALAMAAFLSINLERGFRDYLAARDNERLQDLAAEVVAQAREDGGVTAVRSGNVSLVDVVSAKVPLPPPGAKPLHSVNGQRRMPPPPEALGPRLFVYDWNGTKLHGPPGPADGHWPRHTVRSTLRLDGQAIGLLVLLPRGPAPLGVDARFLASQYRGATVITILLLFASLLPAWLAARAGARLASAYQRASDAIAQGDYTARAPGSFVAEVDVVGSDINAMAEALGQLEQTRRRWLAEIAHELRTPLAALRAELEAVNDGIRPLGDETFQSIREEAEHLGRLVEDLHQLAMADLDALPCTFLPTDAGDVCRAAIDRFARQAQASGLALHFDGRSEAVPVTWDAARIEQLLANALSNALRYTDSPGEVRIALAPANERVVICIDDSAPGVPAQSREALFEPLFRLDEARDRETGGSGLGLAIARAIALAHGGTLTAADSPLGGLRLCLNLPRTARRCRKEGK
ncbi:ATP-binding protein [Novosphingobium album (ex Hu et al. 2023)]|uniref:histidine kinase n=1 Tax=Novosphingobium album (ex Hu et al. 2023) TaxID=2930093 RepID=A0ABT0B3F4_9SPHN|nr:ATP-binding protein [Novosphingobium album (ex Hu et al. 2023)]MCJ2179569.1 ATP-binding protein [Novosphingobium album (ex Hu et al. 2023)]